MTRPDCLPSLLRPVSRLFAAGIVFAFAGIFRSLPRRCRHPAFASLCVAVLAFAPMAHAQRADPSLTLHDLVGSWIGVSRERHLDFEFRIDAIDPQGRVTGASCGRLPGWMDVIIPFSGAGAVAGFSDYGLPFVTMQLTEDHVRGGVVLDQADIRLALLDADRLYYAAESPHPLRARARGMDAEPTREFLSRAEALPCLDRYSSSGGDLPPLFDPDDSTGFVGRWTSSSFKGSVLELAVDPIAHDVPSGHLCVRHLATGTVKVADLPPLTSEPGQFHAHYDVSEGTLSFERFRIEMDPAHKRRPRHDRFVFSRDASGLRLALTIRHGTDSAQLQRASFSAGVHPEGCLARVLPEGWAWR